MVSGDSDLEPSRSLLNQNDRASRATLAQARACSAVRVDSASRAVLANRRKLQTAAPEPSSTTESCEAGRTFRIVNACATPCVSDSQNRLRQLLRFHREGGSARTPHDLDE